MKLFAEQSFTFQPPTKTCHETGCVCWKKRHCRSWRPRAGVLLKRKKLGNLNRKVRPWAELRPSYLIQVLPDTSTLLPWTTWRGKSRGVVVHSNLRLVRRAEHIKLSDSSILSTAVHMALLNARSVVNKTIILNDFYITHGLAFVFITETWLNYADMYPFAELLSKGCNYLSTPRSNRRDGGLAVILNKHD